MKPNWVGSVDMETNKKPDQREKNWKGSVTECTGCFRIWGVEYMAENKEID